MRLALGNRRLMLEQGVSVGVEAQAFMQAHEAQARTCVLVGVNGNVVAAMAIADPLKPEARAVVAALHTQVWPTHCCHAGVACSMLHLVRTT
jgi:cation transport ATPase